MEHEKADLVARRAVARYAAAIDGKDFEAIAAVFAEDGELRRAGTTTNGNDAIAAFYTEFLPTVGHMRHFMTNTLAERRDHRRAVSDYCRQPSANSR
jgi:ketosteroid isomerase-like protein